jgi:glycosylphosphatidylinositol transamidase (GPIT) subunit GPI8
VLLLAYALERSEGIGGTALLDAMKAVVDGTEPSVGNWDADGIAATLAALRSGGTPALEGATGPLRFEPNLYMDLAASTLAQFEIGPDGLVFGARHSTGDPSFLTSEGAFVHPQSDASLADSSWAPTQAKTEAWALVAALSSGWDNYRHQADALRQYWMLRAGGLDDDHIVLILADDLQDHPFNALAGQVRNEPDGEDLYAGAEIDYRLDMLSIDDVDRIVAGEVGPTTPTVLSSTAGSNLYIYLAGHGGAEGIPLGAQTTGEGLAGGDQTLAPEQLRALLCDLRAQDRVRRALVVIEACYSGVFGQALEHGCGPDVGSQPLEGVALLTAASAVEVSYAGAWDNEVPAWVNDAFSNQLALELELGLDRSLADVYTDAYRSTAGSHPGVFNAAHAGALTGIAMGEFFTP